MRFFAFVCAVFFLLVCFPLNSFAGNLFLTPKVGTQGVGADIGYEFTNKLKSRFNVNYFSYSHDDTIDDIEYDADLDLGTVGGLLDYHPFGGNFRLTGGVYYNDNNLDVDANLSTDKTYDIGDETYTASDIGKMNGKITFDDLSPYLGIGWGTSAASDGSWFFSFDVGAMYQGDPNVSLKASNPNNLDKLNKDIDREKGDIEDDIDYKWYPVVAIGVTYRF